MGHLRTSFHCYFNNHEEKQQGKSILALFFVLFLILIAAHFQINQQKLLGEINFFPLNRLIAKPRREVNDPVRNKTKLRLRMTIFTADRLLLGSR